jgi:hypothetical protein
LAYPKKGTLTMKVITVTFALSVLFNTSCTREKQQPAAVVFSATGDINSKIGEFRNQLGVLNTTTGQTTGRREINWDGVPDNMTGLKLPGNFFNPTAPGSPESRQRGLLYAENADAIVSKNFFAEINAQAATEFSNFSGDKSFAVVNAALWPVEFRVAGQTTAATVKGFGIIFSDVDKDGSTFIEYFNGDRSLGRQYVPVHSASSSFSFLGVYFPDEIITRVMVGHEGILQLGEKDISQGGTKDLVILDDFIYSEPVRQ